MRTHPEVIGTLGVLYKRSCRELYCPNGRIRRRHWTGYGRWGTSISPSYDTDTMQNCSPFRYRSIATKGEVIGFLAVPLDVSDVFNDFMILQDSYISIGSDSL